VRKLFAHPVCALIRTFTWAILILMSIHSTALALPLPIGQLNDYANVLDRHGREQLDALIESAKASYGIEVTILASWENPYENIDQYTYAVLDAWGLAHANTILVVFLKGENGWQARLASGESETRAHPRLTADLAAGIADLVLHDRIQEAMVALFQTLDDELSSTHSTSKAPGDGRVLPVLLLIAGAAAAALFIGRRICPRCGRILHTRIGRGFGSYDSKEVVYYCRHCNYSRSTHRRGSGGRGS